MVLVSPARTAVRPEDRFEGIAQGDSRVRLGHSGERSSDQAESPASQRRGLHPKRLLLNLTAKLACFLSHLVVLIPQLNNFYELVYGYCLLYQVLFEGFTPSRVPLKGRVEL